MDVKSSVRLYDVKTLRENLIYIYARLRGNYLTFIKA